MLCEKAVPRWSERTVEPFLAALASGTLAQLGSSFRIDVDRQLQGAPAARGVFGTLIAATALSVVLAVVGLLTALLGAARDERAESDLTEQGVGPRGLRAELRVRLALASVLGVSPWVVIAILWTRALIGNGRAGRLSRMAGTESGGVPREGAVR